MSDETLRRVAKEELDRRNHVGFTCDQRGDEARQKNRSTCALLREILRITGEPYEHDEETCAECQEEERIMEEFYED